MKRIVIIFFIFPSLFSHYIHDFMQMRMKPEFITRSVVRTWSSEIQVSTIDNIPDTSSAPSGAISTDGKFVVSWIRFSYPNNVYVQRFDADGSKAGTTTQVNTNDNFADRSSAPSVAALSDGKFVVSWIRYADSNNVYVQRFDADGSKLGDETQVNTDANFADREGVPSVAALSDGKFVVSWIKYTNPNNVYVQRFNADGSKLGGETQVKQAVIILIVKVHRALLLYRMENLWCHGLSIQILIMFMYNVLMPMVAN